MPTRMKANRYKRGHVSAGHGRIGKARKHPGGAGNSGVQHHHRINMDKYHPGYIGKIGMRHFCFRKNKVVPNKVLKINVDEIWGKCLGEGKYKQYKSGSTPKAPVVDLTNMGIMKVLGNGHLPKIPIIVKARFFTRRAEKKINEAGGVCVLTA